MDGNLLLACGLATWLQSPLGSSELDRLSDHLLRDVGYQRVGGRIVVDPDLLAEPVVPRRGWWPLWRPFAMKQAHA